MTKEPCVSNYLYNFLPTEIDGFDSLAELALDMRWSWNHCADEVWRQLDPALWEFTQNPWVVLQTVSKDKLKSVLADPAFRKQVDDQLQAKHQAAGTPAWFQQKHLESPLKCVAYFSMEYMLSEALPIYSGGLGNVAGDQLKAASDLGVPVIGVGLLYQQGYFRQVIDKDGAQQALYPYNDPGQLPITPVRQPNGEWLRLEITLPGYSVWLRAWLVQVGRVKLYLLDSNDAANFPAHRGITSELYGGGPELRLKQEMLLGIGGWRLLSALGIQPEVCHLNEGHAAFAVLERARSFMQENPQSFASALAVTRAGNLFTTHTAEAAGFDRFAPALIEQYLGRYAQEKLGITVHDLLALGRQNPNDSSESFNMAYLAIRGSGAVNGVSRLHGKVSRHLFEPLFPQWPADEVPVGHVTNGVHMPTWDSAPADALWTEACGKNRWLGTTKTLEQNIRHVSDASLWQFRMAARKSLIDYARQRLARHYAAAGAPPETIEWTKHLFDPNVLTLGFARRFATYKRPNLLLHDPERLLRLLTNHLVFEQIVEGPSFDRIPSRIVAMLLAVSQRPPNFRSVGFRPPAVQLRKIESAIDEHLHATCSTGFPRSPWSIQPDIDSLHQVLCQEHIVITEEDCMRTGFRLADELYPLLDQGLARQVCRMSLTRKDELHRALRIPEFYKRDDKGIPTAWVTRMRESMARLTPLFSANRAVREYTEQRYLPAATAYSERAANKGAVGGQVLDWLHNLEQKWVALRFGEVKVETKDEKHVFEVQVYLDDLDPIAVRVELYANGVNGGEPVRQEMKHLRQLVGALGGYAYSATVPAGRAARDYTARVIPEHPGVAVPLESARILWQR